MRAQEIVFTIDLLLLSNDGPYAGILDLVSTSLVLAIAFGICYPV